MNYKKLVFGIILVICIIIAIYYFSRPNIAYYSANSEFKFGLCSINEPYTKPKIIKNIITQNEAQELINWARPKLAPATIIAEKEIDSYHRNNAVTWLNKDHSISKKILRKVKKYINFPEENFEKIQICNYQLGEYFKFHQDQCYDNNKSCLEDLKRGVKLKPSQLNHRLFNCLLYLNDNFEGGETAFPELKKNINYQ